MSKTREKKIMEYADAPSGMVTLYNYKEPYMRFSAGFGYLGVLLFDEGTDKIQCHLCGNWFGALAHHLHAEHNISASQYKEKVGLRQTSALISESMRAKLIASGLDKRMQNLRAGKKKTQAEKDKISKTRSHISYEDQNQRGTCPEQIIERLKKLYNEIGRTPTSKEVPFYDAMMRIYGTYKNACEFAGIPYNDPSTSSTRNKGKRATVTEDLRKYTKDFIEKNKRLPTNGDFINLYKIDGKNGHRLYEKFRRLKHKIGESEAIKMIVNDDGVYREIDTHMDYSEEELLRFLKIFNKIHNRKPSLSDAKRGLVPQVSTYSKTFGSFNSAIKQAFS